MRPLKYIPYRKAIKSPFKAYTAIIHQKPIIDGLSVLSDQLSLLMKYATSSEKIMSREIAIIRKTIIGVLVTFNSKLNYW